MLRTNVDKVPSLALQGMVAYPRYRDAGSVGIDGRVRYPVGTGAIVYNAKIGDRCVGWAADHLEPGVSSRHSDDRHNQAYNAYSCIGNVAEIISGDAKGAKGFVTGKHGGVDHVMLYFDEETLLKLNIEDRIKIYACGQGLELLDYPSVHLRNLSPELLDKMNISCKNGKLRVGVRKVIPQCMMGAGIGAGNTELGDFDITLHDREMAEKHGLTDLCFGDLVCISDVDGVYGRTWMSGGIMIGVVVHGDSFASGHGPGVTALMSCLDGSIVPVIDPEANLANLFL